MTISFFSIKTQFENVGDALINREMIRLAARHGHVVVDISRCPPEFAALLDPAGEYSQGISWINGSAALFARIFAERSRGRTCYYYISPGGYLGDRKGMQYLTGLSNTAILNLLAFAGVRICHIGVSYERLGPWHARLLRSRAKIISSHFVRDADSANYGRSLGLQIDGVMPDLAFGSYGSIPGTDAARREIAFSFRTDQSDASQQEFRNLVSALDQNLTAELPFRFICQVRRDTGFMEELFASIKRPSSFHDVSGNIDDCMRAYDSCTHIVSNRLHALLVGFTRGARPVPLVNPDHNQKIIGIFGKLDPSISPVDMSQGNAVSGVLTALGKEQVNPDILVRQYDELIRVGYKIYG
jgi:polysaccharide pyruvyl transferase WcaK-like protein